MIILIVVSRSFLAHDDESLPWPTRDNGFRRPMGGQDLVFYFSNGLI